MAKRLAIGAETDRAPDPFAVLRPGLITALVGFSRELPEDWLGQELESRGRPEPSDFPLRDFALFALRNVLGFSWSGPEEKVRWSVYGTFAGVLVALEMRKFGFTICTAKEANIEIKRLCGQLQVAGTHVEDWLAPFAKSRAAKGNVTVANRYNEFESRYRFFRRLADQSYRRSDKKADARSEAKGERRIDSRLRRFRRRLETHDDRQKASSTTRSRWWTHFSAGSNTCSYAPGLLWRAHAR
jgi:hypothetical protein